MFRFSLHVSHSGRCRMHEFPCATHRSRNGARASIVRVVYHAQPLSAMVDQQLNLPPNLCADSPLFVLERLRYLQRGGESVSPLRISPLTEPRWQYRIEPNKTETGRTNVLLYQLWTERDRTRQACTNRLLPLLSLASPLLLITRISSMHLSLNSFFTSNPTFKHCESIYKLIIRITRKFDNEFSRTVERFRLRRRRFQCRALRTKTSRERSCPKRSRHDWFLSISDTIFIIN